MLAPASGPRVGWWPDKVDATGPALLPAESRSTGCLGATPDGDCRCTSAALEALRYRNLKPRGLDGSLQLYVVPTTRGVATVACTTPAGPEAAGFLTNCESVATGL